MKMRADVEVDIRKKIGVFFLDSLKDAKKRLWIMSPWLSPPYAKIAVDKKNEGVEVKVITTNNYVPGHKEALRELTEGKKKTIKEENRGAKVVGSLLILIGLGFLLGGWIISAYLAGFGFILIVCGGIVYVISRGKAEFYWISKIGEDNLMVYNYSPSHPVHAKVYISDGQVAIGSANLTDAGLQRSVESLAIIKSDTLAEELTKKLGTLEKSLGLKRIPTNLVGSQVRVARTSRRRVRQPAST